MTILKKIAAALIATMMLTGMETLMPFRFSRDAIVCAETLKTVNYNYEVNDDGTVTITSYTSSTLFDKVNKVVIPSEINGRMVTGIGYKAFCQRFLNSVTIPDTVTTIGDQAFYNNRLTTVTIPDSVTTIGNHAFSNNQLTSVKIGKSVSIIGDYAFDGCPLTSLTIGESVESIGANAFARCTLTSLDLPETLKVIGECAFADCTKLSVVTIPAHVTNLGERAFYHCTALTSVEIPGSVRDTGNSVFRDCVSLTSVTIGKGVTRIGNSAFYGCTSLTSVTLPDGVTALNGLAFAECSNLASVTIPESVTYMAGGDFRDTPWLASKRAENPLVIVNDILVDGQKCKGYVVIPDHIRCIVAGAFAGNIHITGSIVIPDGVTSINGRTFLSCSGLTSITIPDCVTSIGDKAFYGCYSLPDISIPESVTQIGESAFEDCFGLSEVTIPDSVTTIGARAFQGCKGLVSVVIGRSVRSIGAGAFGYMKSRLPALTSVTILNPYCEIYDAIDTLGITYDKIAGRPGILYGYQNSTAQTYAAQYARLDPDHLRQPYYTFASLGEAPEQTVSYGDVDMDGAFNIADVILLQKWLLAIPDTHLANWKAADLCEDNRLDVFDLCLMKRELVDKKA